MKIGFIDYYLDEWHANNYPKMIQEASKGELTVACAYGQIDSPIGGMTNLEWSKKYGIPLADDIQTLVDRCDGIIVLSPDNCEMHESLCQIPLRSGKPTYVDKTFAPDYPTAKRIFDIAEESGTPCYSTSALRFAEEYAGQDSVEGIAAWGPYGFETYAIHMLEPIVMLMKGSVRRVMYLPGKDSYTLLMDFDGGRTASMTGFMKGAPFAMQITRADGAQTVNVQSDYFGGFIRYLVSFFKDPTRIVPHEDTLEIMAIRGAGVKAIEKPGEWIDL